MDAQNNLYIEGSGDPFLISEEVEYILGALRERGVTLIRGIYVDTSRFALQDETPGSRESANPYDAPASAAGVNFNTVNITVDDRGKVASAEPQTPTLPIMAELGAGLQQGSYRLNICRQGCAAEERAARCTAELFRGLQKREGIAGSGPLGIRNIPAGAKLIYSHANRRNLEQVIFSFLEYSNNFTANMVFLACGTHQFGYPATWDKARRAVREALERVLGSTAAEGLAVYDGAGLSRHNRVTAAAMITVLSAFSEYADLLPEKKGIRIKSGTLDGVYNYAGYLDGKKPFVILLNQEQNTRDLVLQHLQEDLTAAGRRELPVQHR